MDFIERLDTLAKKVQQVGSTIETEEATKNAFVMPFLHSVLGYDVFDPSEVVPEYTADSGIKKGEKVDYAILKDGQVQILIECKKYGESIKEKHAAQLFRYFTVTHARIAILTNGATYAFYTDLDAPNKMDERPFLVLDLEDIDDYIIPELKKLTKSAFDVDSIVDAAGELKYLSECKNLLEEQFQSPDEEFVKFFASRIYNGVLTPKVKQQFLDITKKALKQFLSDSVNDRLKNAIQSDTQFTNSPSLNIEESNPLESKEDKIVTTDEELEGFQIIKAIFRQKFDISRIISRDTQSYFGVLLDDNNRKPLCRLRFNAKQKYIGIFDSNKNETKIPLNSLDDIFGLSKTLLESVAHYD